jgi:hypothetical protein
MFSGSCNKLPLQVASCLFDGNYMILIVMISQTSQWAGLSNMKMPLRWFLALPLSSLD